MLKLCVLNYDLLQHLSYSPNSVPCNFHLFPRLRLFSSVDKIFSTERKLKADVDDYCGRLEDLHFGDVIKDLERR